MPNERLLELGVAFGAPGAAPESATVCVPAVSEIVSVAEKLPVVRGWNLTETITLLDCASVWFRAGITNENAELFRPLMVTLVTEIATVPVFVTVRFCVTVEPTAFAPNANVPALRVTDGLPAAVPDNGMF